MKLLSSTSVKAYKGSLANELSFVRGITEIPFAVYEIAPESWSATVHVHKELLTGSEVEAIKNSVCQAIGQHKSAELTSIHFTGM